MSALMAGVPGVLKRQLQALAHLKSIKYVLYSYSGALGTTASLQ